MPFISSFLIVLARISSIVLNANAENRHPFPPPDLREKASSFSLLSMSQGFSYMAFELLWYFCVYVIELSFFLINDFIYVSDAL